MLPADAITHHADETFARSIVKTLSYRVVIVVLDFMAIYLFTHRLSIAAGFTIVSNVYTTLAYLAHERIWDRIRWGKRIDTHEPAVVPAAPGRFL